MSMGGLSLALLLGGVNASCTRGSAPPAGPAPLAAPEPGAAPAQVWTTKAGRRLTGRLVVEGETIYAAGVDRKVYAVDLTSGQLRWSSRLGGMVTGGVLVSGDTVYAASGRPEGRVYALDAATGQRFWRTSAGASAAPLALIGTTLIAGSNTGVVSGIDAHSGEARWRRRLGTTRVPAVAADSGMAIVATIDSIFRLDPSDGHIAVRAASPGAVVSPWVIHRGLLIAGTTDSVVVAIDPTSLRPRWRVTLDAPVLGSPAVWGDTIYAATRRGSLYRITANSAATATRLAELRWPVTAPVTLYQGLLLLGGADGLLRALRPDGTEAWRLQLRWPIDQGALPLEDGLLAVGGDGDLHRYRR
jgi:outer membrane protein assembly factor BamB